MKFSLSQINTNLIVKLIGPDSKQVIPVMYMDFNVINTVYENEMIFSMDNSILYYDSTAVYICLKYIYGKKIRRSVSTDFFLELLYVLNLKKSSIFLFGDTDACLSSSAFFVEKTYKNILLQGMYNGYNYNSEEVCKMINEKNVEVLFVGLGSERQEKWIIENYRKLNVKVVISVGGWFQYLSGNKKRAPLIIRQLYLEWLYKLIMEFPRIWKRYLWGIPKFFYRVLTKKIVLQYGPE